MDAVLAPTKQTVLAKAAGMSDIGAGAGHRCSKRRRSSASYNTSPLTFASMLSDDTNLAAQLAGYIRPALPPTRTR